MTIPYTTGTVSVTVGSAVVTGVGTAWLTAGVVGGVLGLDRSDGNPIPILSVDSDTTITLAKPWRGATAAAQPYWIVRDTAYLRQITDNAQKLASYIAGLASASIAALSSIAGTMSADKLPYATGAGSMAWTTLSAFMRTLLDDGDQATAKATLGILPSREALTGDRNYYVRPDGSDANDGLDNISGRAFQHIQRAVDAAFALDLGPFSVYIHLADGTYALQVNPSGRVVGRGAVFIVGNVSAPQNVQWTVNNGRCISASGGARLTLLGIKFSTTGSYGDALVCEDAGTILTIGDGVQFGSAASSHILAYAQGKFLARSNYQIVGTAYAHYQAIAGGVIDIQVITVTLAGTPHFYGAFALGYLNGLIRLAGNTYSGLATGRRFVADSGAGIEGAGSGASYLPGDVEGYVVAPGYYR